MKYAVEMRGITKRFPAVVANDGVSLSIEKGTVHAVIGENGAGKSTLMNILYGLHRPDAGEIFIDGEKKQFHSAMDAIRCGIGMVHQHFMLVRRLTVADNVVLGREPKKNGIVYDRRAASKRVAEICKQYGIQVDPEKKVSDISLGMQQRVEIVKTLYRGANIIILDEPTAVLTPQEIDDLGGILQQLKEKGKTIIIITHKLEEVTNFSDAISVLRGGKHIQTLKTSQTDIPALTRLMVGRDVHLGGHKESPPRDEAMLALKDIRYTANGRALLKNVSLVVRKGEILGVAGIDGSGQTQLAEVAAGILVPDAGCVEFLGCDITEQSIAKRKRAGIGFIAEDRQKHGLIMNFTVAENLILGFSRKKEYRTRSIMLNRTAIGKAAKARIARYDIRPPDENARAASLSGGNQQKLVVAREMGEQPLFIIANQPTRGVDIGAIEAIHDILVQHRNAGGGVMLCSLELDEVMMLSDRIAVLYEGKLMDVLDAKTATREQIGHLMLGGEVRA